VCATLGGRASLLGAFLSGFVLSALESAVCTFIGSGWRDIVTFVILIAVLSLDKER
jgi:branched-subunit amino acid ABC-type transport system permease component